MFFHLQFNCPNSFNISNFFIICNEKVMVMAAEYLKDFSPKLIVSILGL